MKGLTVTEEAGDGRVILRIRIRLFLCSAAVLRRIASVA